MNRERGSVLAGGGGWTGVLEKVVLLEGRWW